MKQIGARLQTFVLHDIWHADPAQMPRWQAYGLNMVRLAVVMVRELMGGQLTLRAMSLVYTTLLALVPLLAVSFSVLKAFGVYDQIEPLLNNFLQPLGPTGVELSSRILGFVQNVKVGVLGVMGLGVLLYTVVSLLQKVESAFNFVWRSNQMRSLSRRFSDYLSVILVGPVLVFVAIGMTATITSTSVVRQLIAIEPFGSAFVYAGKIAPFFFVIAAFTFVYIFIPNTRVRLRSALVGAVVGGVMWQWTGVLFAHFVASSTRYEAIYSSFAILILFMFWLYLSWFILLFGAQIAYYHQHPQQIRLAAGPFKLSARVAERVALVIMFLVARSHIRGEPLWNLDRLVQQLGLPGDAIQDQLDKLQGQGLLRLSCDDDPCLLPARDPDSIAVAAILEAVRSAEETEFRVDAQGLESDEVDTVLRRLREARDEALEAMTLKDLVQKKGAPFTESW